jgi:hypothetical protein
MWFDPGLVYSHRKQASSRLVRTLWAYWDWLLVMVSIGTRLVVEYISMTWTPVRSSTLSSGVRGVGRSMDWCHHVGMR